MRNFHPGRPNPVWEGVGHVSHGESPSNRGSRKTNPNVATLSVKKALICFSFFLTGRRPGNRIMFSKGLGGNGPAHQRIEVAPTFVDFHIPAKSLAPGSIGPKRTVVDIALFYALRQGGGRRLTSRSTPTKVCPPTVLATHGPRHSVGGSALEQPTQMASQRNKVKETATPAPVKTRFF